MQAKNIQNHQNLVKSCMDKQVWGFGSRHNTAKCQLSSSSGQSPGDSFPCPLQTKIRARSWPGRASLCSVPWLMPTPTPALQQPNGTDLSKVARQDKATPFSPSPNSPRCSLLFSTAGSVFLRGMVAAMGVSPKLSPGWGRWGGLPHLGSVCPGFGGRGGGVAGESLAATARALWFLSSVNVLGIW